MIAVKLNAHNDASGNPRRGWLVYNADGSFAGFVEEGYGGREALTAAYPGAVEVFHEIEVRPGYFSKLRKAGKQAGIQTAYRKKRALIKRNPFAKWGL